MSVSVGYPAVRCAFCDDRLAVDERPSLTIASPVVHVPPHCRNPAARIVVERPIHMLAQTSLTSPDYRETALASLSTSSRSRCSPSPSTWRHTRKDLAVVFAFFNICLFVVVTVIEMTEVAAALGSGLFAILSSSGCAASRSAIARSAASSGRSPSVRSRRSTSSATPWNSKCNTSGSDPCHIPRRQP